MAEEDESVNQWATSVGAKRCTRCKYWVHKNEGCDHMTCRCGYQFCYVCGGKYQDCDCTRANAARQEEARRLAEEQRQAAEARAAEERRMKEEAEAKARALELEK